MRVAYFDCFAGASGDMILGALVDAGLSLDLLTTELTRLGVGGWQLRVEQAQRAAIRASHIVVEVDPAVRIERRADVERVFAGSTLAEPLKADCLRIFDRLFIAEARVHGASRDDVHLHEMGSLDTLVDITGAVIGLHALGVEAVYVSSLPVSRGTVRTQHGLMPLPAPAVLALLEGVPVRTVDIEAELVTPTGAAILTTLAKGFGRHPDLTIGATGYGAGSRDLPFANILRLLIGETAGGQGLLVDRVTLLETQIDDMPAEWYGHVMELLLGAGALDVYFTAVQMKKSRPGILLTVVTRPEDTDNLCLLLLTHTTTLGVRRQQIERMYLPRDIVTVATRFGPIRAKRALLPDGKQRLAPEYEDCRQVAARHQVPLWEVYQAVQATDLGAG